MDLNDPKTAIQKLKLRGFKVIPGQRKYYINNSGDIINYKTGKILKNYPRKENVRIEGKTFSVPKLVLQAFKKLKYRQKNHIAYKDQDKTNFHVSNLSYCRHYEQEPEPIDNDRLLTAIRCYISVSKKYTVKNQLTTKFYLSIILNKRLNILLELSSIREIFEFYLSKGYAKTAKHFNINILDCKNTVNYVINKLVNAVLSDLDSGKISIQPFQGRKKTTAQLLKEYREHTEKLLKDIAENQGAKDTV